jgi:hypothetical protein
MARTSIEKEKRRGSKSKLGTCVRTTRRSNEPELIEHLIQHGIYSYSRWFGEAVFVQPDNYEELKRVIENSRPSNNVTDEEVKKYRKSKWKINSKKSIAAACSAFQFVSTDPTLPSTNNVTFTNIEPMTNGLIPKPTPHYYDGATVEGLDRRVCEALHKYIVPNESGPHPVVPNFFTILKSDITTDYVANRQAMYWGAVGARAMYHLHSYKGTKYFDNNAYTIVSELRGEVLQIFCTHPSLRDGRIEYHMNLLAGWYIGNNNDDGYRDAVRGWQNIREWARDKRDQFIREANARVSCSSEVSASNSELEDSA